MKEERKWEAAAEKRGSRGLLDIFPLSILALLYFSIRSLVCVCGLRLSDRGSIQVEGRKPDTRVSLSLVQSLRLCYLFFSPGVLPLLTFENKSPENLNFRASRRAGGGKKEKEGLEEEEAEQE